MLLYFSNIPQLKNSSKISWIFEEGALIIMGLVLPKEQKGKNYIMSIH